MKTSTLALASLTPSACLAGIGHSWSFSGSPSGGMKDVTFGFDVSNAAHQVGYYFANQFNFQNVDDVGYTGIQPQADSSSGQASIRAVFSSFQNGTTSSHPNCSDGADGGAGVSCAVIINVDDFKGRFDCIIENIGDTKWRGTVRNAATGQSAVIGEYVQPEGAGGIQDNQVGFLEYFLANGDPDFQCHDQFKTEVSYYFPTSETSGAGTGSIPKPYEYGSCVGDQGFAVTSGSNYWTIDTGF
ncbi:hypothetical protein ISF_06000 [Cordyceps fumosorosea ARSEF 2679]|uniref:Uncharacterized protein n=1 Tax=Cordyceps fumosorosea (strain ARSEF 2679) TaxID=1081104 RepID=A0A167SW55_CORFA|nr:hypothetical protein ISF_06000 [Cordyceps fumosorosea ARSEF 2679]OAA59989.1 hypothetical protein ISF_06000 [Cordyceps fumosorosea ARSEF 2679]